MSIGRTILALFVAISVAVLPLAGSAALQAKATAMAAVAADMSDDMPDCCPHQAGPGDGSMSDCGCMAACALSCFGMAAADFSMVRYPSVVARIAPALASNPYRSQPRSPPFRPPRA